MSYGHPTTLISEPSIPESVSRNHQGPRRGAGSSRLRSSVRRRERRAAARADIDIGDTSEEAVNFNATIPEPVEEK